MSCVQCDVVSGAKTPAGGLVLETPLFVAHALLGPSPLRGWVVLAPKRHARWWWELSEEELRELGPLAKRLLDAQRSALGAVHGYAFAIGDVLHHMHLHLVPRFADTPKSLWGRAAFDADPRLHLAEEDVSAAARQVARALSMARGEAPR